MELPATPDDVANGLRRVFPEARLARIPRHPQLRDVLLALICRHLRRRVTYSEPEINDYLEEQLELLKAEVDYVTCRRYLIDCGFVKRDRAGIRYLLNFPKLEETLTEDALDAGDDLLRVATTPKPRRRGPPRERNGRDSAT